MLPAFTFGVEFEVIFPAPHSNAARELSAQTGIAVNVGDRLAPTHAGVTAWKIVHDGSVRGTGFGGELVSPILQGADGLAQVETMCRALTAIGASVNQSCGFHVHVGARGGDLAFFKNLVKLYAKFEPVIDGLMPASRRGGTNVYCRSLASANLPAVDSAASFAQLVEAQTGIRATGRGPAYHQRFFKLNLTAFQKHSTVEFRQHAGTIDAEKATNWIKCCLRMVAAAKAGKTGMQRAPRPTSFDHLRDSKTRRTAEMICRPEGATRSEIIAGTDWAALSVNRQARLAGIQVTVVRSRGVDRFYAVADAGQDTPIDLPAFVALIEAADAEAEFLNRRQAELRR
jgi:hypothetical protein